MKVTVMMDQTFMMSTMRFRHTTTIPLMKRTTMTRMDLFRIGNGNLSQMIWKLLISDHYGGPHGMKESTEKTFLLLLNDYFLQVD